MAISKKLEYVHLDSLLLDPKNPRLRRDVREKNLDQPSLLTEMSAWTLDELVDSFIQSGGFWTQDALIVVRDEQGGKPTEKYVVIEGNRRVAALKLMYEALFGNRRQPKWLLDRMSEVKITKKDELFCELPILVADDREDVTAYLGFRHVTGIKQWRPVEKAEFITRLVDDGQLSFRDVAREIGSRTDAVRQNYVAFKMLLQMEAIEGFDWNEVEERFSLLFLSIRSEGTRDFLGVKLEGVKPTGHPPIPESKTGDAKLFAGWVFGAGGKKPVVRESRNVDRFGEILATPRAVEYLSKSAAPDFETAYSLTTSADLVIDPINEGTRHLRLALSELDGRGKDKGVQEAAWPAIECGVLLAQKTGEPNLSRAKEALGAS